LTDIADSGDASSATTAALESAASIVDCLATSSGAYSSEKYEIMKNEEDKGGILIPGEEISLKFYAQLAGSVALCATTSKCDDILNTMTGLWDDTELRQSATALFQPYVHTLPTLSSQSKSTLKHSHQSWTNSRLQSPFAPRTWSLKQLALLQRMMPSQTTSRAW